MLMSINTNILDMILDLIEKEVIFGADLSNSEHANNKKRNILVLG